MTENTTPEERETLPGLADDTPPAMPFIRELLRAALEVHDRKKLPDMAIVDACETNGEVAALYAPYFADLYNFLFHSSLAHALIRVHEASPNLAAGIAREVKDWLDAGDAYPEWVWDWAAEAGDDPEKIIAESRAKHEAWLVESRKPRIVNGGGA